MTSTERYRLDAAFRERAKARAKKWKAKNPERSRALTEAWTAANPDRRREIARMSYHRRKAAKLATHN